MNPRILTCATALTLLMVGCGTDTKSALPNASTTSSTSSTVTPSTSTTDKAAATKLVLTAADVPSGWTESPPTPDSADATAFQTRTNACLGEPPQAELLSTKAAGNTFTQGNNVIFSEADVYKTADLAAQDQKKTSDSKYWPCVEAVFTDSVKASFATSNPSATVSTKITSISGVTTDANQTALRLTATVKATQGVSVIYSDVVGYSKDRTSVSATLQLANTTPSAAFDKQLLVALLAHQDGSGTGPGKLA